MTPIVPFRGIVVPYNITQIRVDWPVLYVVDAEFQPAPAVSRRSRIPHSASLLNKDSVNRLHFGPRATMLRGSVHVSVLVLVAMWANGIRFINFHFIDFQTEYAKRIVMLIKM